MRPSRVYTDWDEVSGCASVTSALTKDGVINLSFFHYHPFSFLLELVAALYRRATTKALMLRLLLVTYGLSLITIRAKMLSDRFFHRQNAIVKFPFC